MAVCTIPQCPELLLTAPSKDSQKARYYILEKIVGLINSDRLPVDIPEGFSTRQIIEMTEQDFMADGEDKISQAVKILAKLADAKRRMHDSHEKATDIRQLVNLLFETKKLSDEEYQKLEKGFKILKEYAQAYLRYKEALGEAEEARIILDKALEVIE